MAEEVSKIEFENNMFQLSLHGVSKEDIEKLRNKFEAHRMTDDEKKRIEKNELAILRHLGGHIRRKNKTNKTRVVR